MIWGMEDEESRSPVQMRPATIKAAMAPRGQAKRFLTLALEKSLSRPSRLSPQSSKYQAIADWVVDLAEGEFEDADYKIRMEAVKFLTERLEGRPHTQIEYTGQTQHTRVVLKWQDSHIIPDIGDDPLTPLSYEALEPGEYTELPDGPTD